MKTKPTREKLFSLKNCKLSSAFPNSPNLYTFGLQATEILFRFMLYFVLLNFLWNHFVTDSEPNINLNFQILSNH